MQPPSVGEWIAAACLGAVLGGQVNRGVVAWRWFLAAPYGPWSPLPNGKRRPWVHFVPVLGWWLQRAETTLHGRGFWVRPMAVELLGALVLPLFLAWSRGLGGWPESWLEQASREDLAATWNAWGVWRFLAGVALLAAMAIATLIDLDEKTIPDQVTIPMTLLALLLGASGTPISLPIAANSTTGPWTLESRDAPSDAAPLPLTLASPADHVWETDRYWGNDNRSVPFALFVVVAWGFALLPKVVTWRRGFFKGIELLIASIRRPARKRMGRLKPAQRQVAPLTWWVSLATLIAIAMVLMAAWRGGEVWKQTLSSVMGIAIGGGVVWAVRIVGTAAMGREAMGFGDVTLMAMIGAFLGWQPSLIIFALAPFTAIVIILMQRIVTRDVEIAFGPYLCLATVIVVAGWDGLWNRWASIYLAVVGDLLPTLGGLALVLGGGMLIAWGWIKQRLLGTES